MTPDAGLTRARVACIGLAVALPVGKAIQLELWEGWDVARQVILLVVAVATVGLTVRPVRGALFDWQVAMPRPSAPGGADVGWAGQGRGLRLALGATAVGLCALSAVSYVRGWDDDWTVGLTAGAAIPLVVLASWEWGRAHRVPNGDDGPDRAVLWTVAPATICWIAVLLTAAVRYQPFDGTLGDFELPLVGGAGGRALGTAVVIGFGEEYLFRGLLLVLAVRARLTFAGFLLVGVSFGAWHLPDVWDDGAVAAGVTFAAMLAVSQLVLVPIRLRSRTLAGPALLHAANNLALRLV